MLKETLRRAVFGYILGMAVGNVIAAMTGHPNIVSASLLERAGSLNMALLWQTLLSGLIGAAGMGGTTLYDLDRLPLLAIDTLHYVLCMAVCLSVGRILGWFPSRADVLITAAIMYAVHFCIFLTMCAYYRAQVRELNLMQKQFLTENQTLIS